MEKKQTFSVHTERDVKLTVPERAESKGNPDAERARQAAGAALG